MKFLTIKSPYPNMGRAKLKNCKINNIIRAKIKGQSYKQIARDLKISVSISEKKSWKKFFCLNLHDDM